MKGVLSLVLQGFPRADIDVHGVRIDRNAIIRLTNDHKAISKQLEELLHKLHALARCVGCATVTWQPGTSCKDTAWLKDYSRQCGHSSNNRNGSGEGISGRLQAWFLSVAA